MGHEGTVFIADSGQHPGTKAERLFQKNAAVRFVHGSCSANDLGRRAISGDLFPPRLIEDSGTVIKIAGSGVPFQSRVGEIRYLFDGGVGPRRRRGHWALRRSAPTSSRQASTNGRGSTSGTAAAACSSRSRQAALVRAQGQRHPGASVERIGEAAHFRLSGSVSRNVDPFLWDSTTAKLQAFPIPEPDDRGAASDALGAGRDFARQRPAIPSEPETIANPCTNAYEHQMMIDRSWPVCYYHRTSIDMKYRGIMMLGISTRFLKRSVLPGVPCFMCICRERGRSRSPLSAALH